MQVAGELAALSSGSRRDQSFELHRLLKENIRLGVRLKEAEFQKQDFVEGPGRCRT
jgi:hypothetical protein